MRKTWIYMSLLSLSLACTLRVEADFIDMGGFQIQVEQKEDTEAETGPQTGEEDREKLEKTSPVPEEQIKGQEKEVEKAEAPGFPSEEEISPEEEGSEEKRSEEEGPAEEQGAEGVWMAVQQDTGIVEGDIAPVLEEIQEEAGILQGQEGQEGIDPACGEKEVQEDIKPARGEKERQETAGSPQVEKGEKEERVRRGSRGREKTEEIRFVHEDVTRILGKGSLAVRLEGEQEVCILSYAVDHKECAYRWEQGCLVPLDASIQKGVNCLEISVLLPDGQIVSMEPWYFSCGAGLAVL